MAEWTETNEQLKKMIQQNIAVDEMKHPIQTLGTVSINAFHKFGGVRSTPLRQSDHGSHTFGETRGVFLNIEIKIRYNARLHGPENALWN